MSEYRIVLCESCGGEGRLIRCAGVEIGYGYIERDEGPCPACEGTGLEVIAVEPITLDDLTE